MTLSKAMCLVALVALLSIACRPASTQGVTVRECRQLVPSVGADVLSFLDTQVCDQRGFFRSLRRSCRLGLCDGLPGENRCARILKQTGRFAIGPFCDPLTSFDDLPLPIFDLVALDVGFQVPVTCWPSKVCLKITHTYMSDLTVSIRGPSNERYLLVDRFGESGNNMDACFANQFGRPARSRRYNFRDVPVIQGNFGPVDRLPNSPTPGNWIVRVNDKVGRDEGILNSADVTFSCRS